MNGKMRPSRTHFTAETIRAYRHLLGRSFDTYTTVMWNGQLPKLFLIIAISTIACQRQHLPSPRFERRRARKVAGAEYARPGLPSSYHAQRSSPFRAAPALGCVGKVDLWAQLPAGCCTRSLPADHPFRHNEPDREAAFLRSVTRPPLRG
jgi:hypothetical protein